MSIFMPMSMSCSISTTSRVVRHLILFGFHLLTATNTSSCHHRRNSPSIAPSIDPSTNPSTNPSISHPSFSILSSPASPLHMLSPPLAFACMPIVCCHARGYSTAGQPRTAACAHARMHSPHTAHLAPAWLDVWSQRGFDCACDGSQSSRALVPAACKVTTLPHRRTLFVSIASTTPRSYCLRSLAIPLGICGISLHLRGLIVYLWDILSYGILVAFCGTLVDF